MWAGPRTPSPSCCTVPSSNSAPCWTNRSNPMALANPPPSREDALAALLADYLQQLDAGRQPDPATLGADRVGLAAELESFIEAARPLDRLARPLQELNRPGAVSTLQPQNATDPGLPGAVPPSAAPPVAPPPKMLGKYELLGELGRGGMGLVYKARQPGLDRLVAIKVI